MNEWVKWIKDKLTYIYVVVLLQVCLTGKKKKNRPPCKSWDFIEENKELKGREKVRWDHWEPFGHVKFFIVVSKTILESLDPGSNIVKYLFGKDLSGSNTGGITKSSQGEGDFRIMNS